MSIDAPATVTDTTSSLQRYLDEIEDTTLKANLAREISSLQRQFGLVFERHHPEGIRLPKHTVKRGSKVVISADKSSTFYRVKRIDRETQTAMVVDALGNEAWHALNELTVAKEFGDIAYPGLRKLSEIRRGDPEAPVHTIINGENYHALEALQYTHAGKVDLIYIDPPYNTGNADWKYNDRYIDKNDGYRHSKWLSFIEKRLLIAKSLLKPTGVVIMAIDDNEQARLKMLADQVFGENNFMTNIVWNGGRKNDSRFSSVGHDYMLVYALSKEATVAEDIKWRDRKRGVDEVLAAGQKAWESSGCSATEATKLLKKWFSSQPKDHPSRLDGNYNYNNVDSSGRVFYRSPLNFPNGQGPTYAVIHPVTGLPVKQPNTGWRCSEETMLRWIAEDKIAFGKDETTNPSLKSYLAEIDSQPPASVFEFNRKSTAQRLTHLLGDNRFPFPKEHSVLMRWFRMIAPQDAVVLDFFGGSGTTAEAVIRLNAEDGGTRQCILVTNNELAKTDDMKLRKAGRQPGDDEYEAFGVFHHVTKPRIETVVSGTREDGSKYSDGLAANVAFFEMTYVDEPEVVSGKAFNDLAGLFWLKAGGVGGTVELTSGAKADGFAVSDAGNMAVLFSPGRAKVLAEKIAASGNSVDHLFIVTDSEAQGDEAASYFGQGVTIERIYGSYLEAFQVNRKD